MAEYISGQADSYNLPNYQGLLTIKDNIRVPMLQIVGGLGAGRIEANREFAVNQYSDFPDASQPAISESASTTAPTAISYARAQIKNVTQIFQEKISVTDRRQSQYGRIAGVATSGVSMAPADEIDYQAAQAMNKVRRDLNYTMYHGAYNLATTNAEVDKTRGLFEALTSSDVGDGETVVSLSSALPTLDNFKTMFQKVAEANGQFQTPVIVASALNRQLISELYGFQPSSTNVGGVAIDTVVTEFGNVGVIWDQMVGDDKILLADMSVISLVYNVVPGKGNFYLEPLAKTGAASEYQIVGYTGVDFGPWWFHGAITGISHT